jgi:predicted phage-related endonuclease
MSKPINISASRGAAILGLSSWKTPVQTWLEIMESREPEFCIKNNFEFPIFEETAALRFGKAFESAVIELAERKQGFEIIGRETYDFHSKYDYVTCHLDGVYDNLTAPPENKPLHEGKTTSAFYFRDHFGEPGTDQVPMEYQIQCQHQMICTGAEKVILSVLVFPRRVEEWEEMGWDVFPDPPEPFILKRGNCAHIPETWAIILDEMGYFHQFNIHAHPELHALMLTHYRDFWENNILTGTPPVPKTYDDIRALVRDPIGTIVADENIERLMAEYHNIKSEIGGAGPLAKRAEQIKVDILQWMRGAGVVIDEDSQQKWILRDNTGHKIASYGKNKNGILGFR